MSNIIRAIRANVELGDYSFDAYEMPDGERRVGYAGAASVLGYQKNWIGGLAEKGKKQLEAMRGMGYTGLAIEVEVVDEGVSITHANTLSLPDFNKIVGYEALKKKNEKAIVMLLAMSEFGFERTVELAFKGKSLDRILSKIVHYSKWTHEEFMQALLDNREDIANLRLGLGGR